MRFAIYPRKSKKSDMSQSMEQQVFDCEQYIKSNFHDYEIVVYGGDYAITGHSTKNRKDFQRMMRDVKNHLIDAVVVMRYDRIARNTRDFCNLYYEMEQVGCNLISVSQRIDTSTPYGKKFMYDLASTAELEWAIISERYKDSARYKIQNGYAYTGRVPTGFKIDVVDGRKKVVHDHPEVTREILEYYRRTRSKRATVVYVRENLMPDFTPNKLNAMLGSDLFFGACRDNRNFCEPYYSESEFMELRNISQIKSTPSGNIYLFTGMIRCPICGAAMCGLYANRKVSEKHGGRKLYTYYRCSKGGKYKLHKMNTLNQDTVEKYLIDNLDSELEKYITDVRSRSAKKKDTSSQQLKLKDELQRVNYMFEKGRITPEDYDAKYTSIMSKLSALQKDTSSDERKIVQLAKKIPDDWLNVYADLDLRHRQQFWHGILSDITIDSEFHITGFHFL